MLYHYVASFKIGSFHETVYPSISTVRGRTGTDGGGVVYTLGIVLGTK
jgi:hypothetical protein